MQTIFEEKKRRILKQLEVPDAEYSDLSPKGSIDAGIRQLIDEINAIHSLVTTSSCAGRVSVYVEGLKQTTTSEEEPVIPSSGGKGGGKWLYVSHDPVTIVSSLGELFGFKSTVESIPPYDVALVHFKFEAMVCYTHRCLYEHSLTSRQILHLMTASLEDAKRVLTAASISGFRESGAMGLSSNKDGSITPMVAVRSNGLALDSVIGYINAEGEVLCIVGEGHLRLLNDIAIERFRVNTERIARFREALFAMYHQSESANEVEDAAGRRARKKAEGLAKQEQLRAQKAVLTKRTPDQDRP
jgi:tRNA wybutosine-synthesizing protein 3